MRTLTDKEAAEKRRIDRRVFSGKATRAEVLRGLELKQKREQVAPKPGTAAGEHFNEPEAKPHS